MHATVRWEEGVRFRGESASGHQVIMDGAPEAGGDNRGMRPMEMVLLGMGGCSSFDVIHILKKSRQQVTDCELQLEAERADSDPKVFTRIHLHFIVSGRQLEPSRVAKAVELSAEKYCSASIMLSRGGVAISHDFEIINVS
ncbi:MAG: OsmC family protein [Gammaproteobacteria bacterium]|nr:OsmC family protein [Gammaproteobacteria bacterium]